jgi:hypothetical protein
MASNGGAFKGDGISTERQVTRMMERNGTSNAIFDLMRSIVALASLAEPDSGLSMFSALQML